MQTSWEFEHLKESAPNKKIEYMVRIDDPTKDQPSDSYFYTLKQAQEWKAKYLKALTEYDWMKQAKLKKFANTPNYAEKVWNDLLTNGVKIYRVITSYVEVEDDNDIPSLFTSEN